MVEKSDSEDSDFIFNLMNIDLNQNDELNLSPIQENLINVLKKNGSLNRSQMVQLLDKPRTTIYDNLTSLVSRDIIKKFTKNINSRGRPVVFFKLKEE